MLMTERDWDSNPKVFHLPGKKELFPSLVPQLKKSNTILESEYESG